MYKSVIGWGLIVLGFINVGNFFAHHNTATVSDNSAHALEGFIMLFFGVMILRSTSFLNNWNNFKD
jgi:hypothetical protein